MMAFHIICTTFPNTVPTHTVIIQIVNVEINVNAHLKTNVAVTVPTHTVIIQIVNVEINVNARLKTNVAVRKQIPQK
jgi:hypothetical protein